MELQLSGIGNGRVKQALQRLRFEHVKFEMSTKDSSRGQYMHHDFGKIPGLET